MKKLFLFSIVLHISLLSVSAQKNDRPFRAYLYNNEYEVFMRLDLYGESITVPGQELYGTLPEDKTYETRGAITQAHLEKQLKKRNHI